MPANQVGNDRGHAPIGHQLESRISHLIEHLASEMHQRAVAAVTECKLVGLLCHGDDVAKRLSPQRIRGCQDERHRRKAGNGRKILVRVIFSWTPRLTLPRGHAYRRAVRQHAGIARGPVQFQ